MKYKTLPWVLVNNKIKPLEQSFISVTDLGFNYGQGVFTTILLDNGCIHFYDEHKNRLRNWAYQLKIEMPEVTLSQIVECIHKNKALSGLYRIKIIISQGYDNVYSYVLIHQQDRPSYTEGLSTASFEACSHGPLSTMKTLSYMTSIYPRLFTDGNYDEYIRTDHDGQLIEGSVSNILWFDGQRLLYPDESLLYIAGVGMKSLIGGCKIRDIECLPIFEYADQSSFEGTFFSVNCINGPRPIARLDGRELQVDSNHVQLLQEMWKEVKNRSSMIIKDLI